MNAVVKWGLIAVAGVFALGSASPLVAQQSADGEWRTYGGDLWSTRYKPFAQIDRANFSSLEVAWRFKTDALGPGPEFNFQATPLMVNGVVYTTAGSRTGATAGRRASCTSRRVTAWSRSTRRPARASPASGGTASST